MDKNKFQELGKICSNNSILVINNRGIYRLFTPFKAVCIIEIESIAIGQEVAVISVKMTQTFRIVYLIKGRAYYHHYFMITSPTGAPLTTFN